MAKTEQQGKLIKEYLKKFPTLSKRALARKLKGENPLVFNTSEDAIRSSINYYTTPPNSNRGSRSADKVFLKEFLDLKKSLPKGESDKIAPYHLPKGRGRVLLLSDIHFPYHDDDALFAALEYGIEKEADTIWLNGDIMDCYQLSRFEHNPSKRDFKYEIDITKQFLQGLRNMFPNALIIYKIANHECRWEKFIQAHPQLFDIPEFQLSALLGFKELGIVEIADKQMGYCGELRILHGHEITSLKSGGVNPARAMYLKTGESCIFGHFHRKSEHTERTLSGKLIKIYSTGTLGDLYPSYMPYNNWNHGFAFIEVERDGSYRVENKTIIDGIIY